MKQKRITKFFDEYRFLSNFWPCNIEYDGIKYHSVEHAYQAQKTLDLEEREYISKLHRAGDAKQYGKGIKIRSDWDSIKLQIMRDLVEQKFKNNNKLKGLLLATDDAILIEGNTWGDTYWGICNGIGENHLGIILMQTRRGLFDEE